MLYLHVFVGVLIAGCPNNVVGFTPRNIKAPIDSNRAKHLEAQIPLALFQKNNLLVVKAANDSSDNYPSYNHETIILASHEKDIAKLALPALFSLLVDPVLSIVDTAYTGRLGPTSIASLGPCTSIFHFSFNTFRALTQSTTSLVSGSLARGDKDAAGAIAQQTMIIALFLGILVGLMLITQARPMLALMGAGQGSVLHEEAYSYLSTRAYAAPAVLLLTVCEGMFRGHGDTRTPAIASLIAAFANLFLDPVLMFQCKLGVAGAALATVYSQYLALFTYFAFIVRNIQDEKMRFPIFSRRLDMNRGTLVESYKGKKVNLLKSILFANGAMLVRTISLMACWASVTSVATRMGTLQVGAHQVGLSVWLLLALVAEAPSIAAQVLGARHLGKRQVSNARSMGIRAFSIALFGGSILGGALLTARNILPSLFTKDLTLARQIRSLIPVLALQQPLVACTLVMEGLLVGAGQFKYLAITTIITTGIGTAGILGIGKFRPYWGVIGLWMGVGAIFLGRFVGAAGRLLDRKSGPYWTNDSTSEPKNV